MLSRFWMITIFLLLFTSVALAAEPKTSNQDATNGLVLMRDFAEEYLREPTVVQQRKNTFAESSDPLFPPLHSEPMPVSPNSFESFLLQTSQVNSMFESQNETLEEIDSEIITDPVSFAAREDSDEEKSSRKAPWSPEDMNAKIVWGSGNYSNWLLHDQQQTLNPEPETVESASRTSLSKVLSQQAEMGMILLFGLSTAIATMLVKRTKSAFRR